MIKHLLTRSRFLFSKLINEHNYESIKNSFGQSPEIQTLGEYFCYENALPIFAIIRETPLQQKTQKLMLYNELQALCQKQEGNSDENLNVLANIHFQKAIELQLMGNIELFLKETHAAISTIEIMQYPDSFFLGELYRNEGSGFIKLQQYQKAENSLTKGQNQIKQLIQDALQDQQESDLSQEKQIQIKVDLYKNRICLGRIYTQITLISLRQNRDIEQIKRNISKALEQWEQVENHQGIPFFEQTMRMKCLISMIEGDQPEATFMANQFLEYLNDPQKKKLYDGRQIDIPILWFSNFVVGIISQNTEGPQKEMRNKYRDQVIQLLKKRKNEVPQPHYQMLIRSTGIKLESYGLA